MQVHVMQVVEASVRASISVVALLGRESFSDIGRIPEFLRALILLLLLKFGVAGWLEIVVFLVPHSQLLLLLLFEHILSLFDSPGVCFPHD